MEKLFLVMFDKVVSMFNRQEAVILLLISK